ncbi:MAG: hypothetical protein ABJH05_01890 [Fulvivirga sp.]
MKKLFTILALVSFMGIFSACEEEEIMPDQLETTNKGDVAEKEDEGQWD